MTNSAENLGEEKEGVRWLKAVGRPDVIGKPWQLRNGNIILAEDFPEVSSDSANSMRAIDLLGPDNPVAQSLIGYARQMLEGVYGPPPDQI